MADYAEVYRLANEPRLVSRTIAIEQGSFTTDLPVPAEARGPCHVRVFLEGPQGCAAGAACSPMFSWRPVDDLGSNCGGYTATMTLSATDSDGTNATSVTFELHFPPC